MSYLALATERFEAMREFYGETLGFPTLRAWDRPSARGVVLDLHGLRLELLDARRESRSLDLPAPGDRVQLVIEVPDLDRWSPRLAHLAPPPVSTSWGARLVQFRDPDGVPVVFLEWLESPRAV